MTIECVCSRADHARCHSKIDLLKDDLLLVLLQVFVMLHNWDIFKNARRGSLVGHFLLVQILTSKK